jgi:hypothetical protein
MKRALILHGLTRGELPSIPDAFGEAPLVAVRFEELTAVLTGSGSNAHIASTFANPEAVEALAIEHNRILTDLATQIDVAPVRLGTVLSGDAAAEDLLRDNAGEFRARLDRVAGCVEYSVELVRTASSPAPSEEDEGDAAGGRGYLQARGRAARARRERRNALDALSVSVEAKIATACREVIREAVGAGASVGRQSWALLVEKGSLAKLEAALTASEADAATLGYRVQGTGPWPAYNFADAP